MVVFAFVKLSVGMEMPSLFIGTSKRQLEFVNAILNYFRILRQSLDFNKSTAPSTEMHLDRYKRIFLVIITYDYNRIQPDCDQT